MTGNLISCSKSKDKKDTVQYFYEKEPEDWHRNIHKRSGTVEENINDTVSTISKNSVMYEVFCGLQKAAFFVKYVDDNGMAIEGFHIKKEYRVKSFIKQFWIEVAKVFEGEVAIGLHKGNTQAIRHVMKQGFLPVKDVLDNGKIFVILKHTLKS